MPRKPDRLKFPNWHFPQLALPPTGTSPNWPSPQAKILQLPVHHHYQIEILCEIAMFHKNSCNDLKISTQKKKMIFWVFLSLILHSFLNLDVLIRNRFSLSINFSQLDFFWSEIKIKNRLKTLFLDLKKLIKIQKSTT